MKTRACGALRVRVSWAFASAALILSTTRSAFARTHAELVYRNATSDPTCPDESELRRRVATHIGYDPFDLGRPRAEAGANDTMHVEASLLQVGTKIHGKIEIASGSEVVGVRELEGTNDCSALANATALAIALALDPAAMAGSAPALPAPARSTPSPPPTPPPVSSSQESQSPPPSFEVALAPLVSVGIAPAVAPGFQGSFGLRFSALSIWLEGRADLSSSAHLSTGGDVTTSAAMGALVPCAHLGQWSACAILAVGSMRAQSTGVSLPAIDYALYAHAGIRGAVAVPLSPMFAIRPTLDGFAALSRPSVELNGQTIWSTPPISGTLGVALLVDFGSRGAF